MNGVQGTTGVAGAMVHAAQRADLSVRFTPEQQQVILDTCCGGAPVSEARALIAIAEARGLNPILGECYFVKRWDSEARRERWAVQAAIDSFRIKAEQTGLYAGQDEPEYEYDEHGQVTVARVKVWRKDWTRPAVGVARWSEYVQTTKEGKPTRFWSRMPHNQLAKCAEALALRKAFPAVLAKIYVSEEMDQADNETAPVPQMTSGRTAPALPPAPPVDGATFAKLCARLDAAEDLATINTIASAAGKAHKAGQLADGDLDSLKASVIRKRGLVSQTAPEPPPSSPAPVEREPGEEG
jgi:phage recombination protein Bet